MPFLSNFADKYNYKKLSNVIGYSFAIQSCLLSGKYPEENNQWLPYYYSPEQSPLLFKFLKKFLFLTQIDTLFPKIYNIMMILIRKKVLRKGVHINNIPLKIIDSISLYPYYFLCELPSFFELKNILKKYQTDLSYIGPPKIKDNIYSSLLKHIEKHKNKKELIVIYEDRLDHLGHVYSPSSIEYLNYVKIIDRSLSNMYNKIIKKYKNDFHFLIFSDHGQCDQKYNVDILSHLKTNELKLGRDYLCFIDATMAFFWPKNLLAKDRILNVLHNLEMGKIIDESLKNKYFLNFKDNKYGDIYYILKPKWTFFPNFYSGTGIMKGLHGYTPDDNVQDAILISNEEIPFSVQHVKDVKKLLIKYFLF